MGAASGSTWWTPIADIPVSGTDLVRVGLIGRPHGIRGEVTVNPTTDAPDERFAAGMTMIPSTGPHLLVGSARRSGPVFVVGFAGIDDRNAAETLRGIELSVPVDLLPEVSDEDDFYDHQLIGLAVEHVDGRALGRVVDVLHPPAAPVLVVRRPSPSGDGNVPIDELVPFVRAIATQVDLVSGRVTVDPPDGMFAD